MKIPTDRNGGVYESHNCALYLSIACRNLFAMEIDEAEYIGTLPNDTTNVLFKKK